jgi:hypothetical protein
MNIINRNDTAGAKLSIDRLQSEATNFARSNGRATANNLYRPGTRTGTTPEQAFAAALESNPEVYAEARDKHNSAALVAQLQRAGYKLTLAG